MDRENLQAKLQDIPKLELEDRIEAYENLFDKVDIDPVEEFPYDDGKEKVVMEVRRRIWMTYKITKNLGLDRLQERVKKIFQQNFS
jgi:hypothetical protein